MTKNLKQLFILYNINQGLHWFAMGIIIPVMILTLMDFGFDIGQIGISMGVMGATIMILELPTGGFADTIGRKRVYMISCVINICAYILILFASNFIQLIITVVLKGIGRALSSGSMDAWFVDEHKRLGGDERLLQRDLARSGAVVTAVLGLGTLAGGFIPDIFGSFRANIILLIFLLAFQVILTGVLIKENRELFSGHLTDGFRQFPHVLSSAVTFGLRQRNILIILITSAVFGFALSGVEQLWQPRVMALSPGNGTWVLGVLSAGYFLSAAAGSLASTAMLGLFGGRYKLVLFVFRILSALFYIGLSFAAGIGSFASMYFIMFLFQGISDSPKMTIFNRSIPSERRSSLLSLRSLFFQGSGALGSIFSGQIALHFSIPAAWQAAGILFLASAFIFLFIRE